MPGPKTLLEAVRHFSDLDVCFRMLIAVKFPDGKIVCPECGGDKVGVVRTRRLLQCKAKDCRKQIRPKQGTIFEDSPLPLDKWFVAVWSIANAKNGISSCEIARALGVTQKTAWFMLHRIRLAMRSGTFSKMTDVVESDETFVGGRAINMHAKRREKAIQGRGGVGKAIVHGLLERTTADKMSQVRAAVVPNTEASTILPNIAGNVDAHAVVCTDAASTYAGLTSRFIHRAVDHAVQYAMGKVHINGIENFWCLLKRGLKGTYTHVALFHLFRYVDEQAWRFNQRELTDGGRFARVLAAVVGKRLTFRFLCAIDDAGFMGLT